MSVSRELVAWALALRAEDLPADVSAAASRHLLDGFGTAVAASRRGLGAPAVTVAEGLGGPAEATLLGRGVKIAAPAAALATGTLVHALDFDDTHAGGLVHASAVVAPAVLAVGEQVGATGSEALAAAVVGYETVCRIAGSAPHAFHARGLHATSVCGVFAAALVAAKLMDLDEDRTVHALGIAGSSAGGLLEFLASGASTKQLHPGLASQAGILAARLAQAGADGPDTVLEGGRGMFAALTDKGGDIESITADLGSRWETTRISIKPYPSCQLMHATLDAVATLLPLAASDVLSVSAVVHPDSAEIVCEPRADKIAPRTVYDAKFSLPWSVAALLVDGAVTIDTYREDALARPELLDLAERVEVRVVSSPGVAGDARGNVIVELADGQKLEGAVAGSSGTPDHPLTDEAFAAKLAANVGGADAAAALAALVADLAASPNLTEIVETVDRLAHPEATS